MKQKEQTPIEQMKMMAMRESELMRKMSGVRGTPITTDRVQSVLDVLGNKTLNTSEFVKIAGLTRTTAANWICAAKAAKKIVTSRRKNDRGHYVSYFTAKTDAKGAK